MLRALFVVAAILFGLRQSMKGPFHALLFYLWWAYFRPDQWLWWDFVSQFNVSLVVGVLVLAMTLFSGRRLQFGNGAWLMLLMAGQALVATLFSPAFDYAFPYWVDFAKSTVISFLIVTLVDDEKKLRATFVVFAFSLGFEATKQGWAQLILNPGAANANDHAVLGDNNGVAVGMLMLLAMLVALGRTTALWKHEKHLYRFMAVGVVYRALSTYSRGGFLAAGAFGLLYLLRSRNKLPALIGVVLVTALIVPALPSEYWDRMNTIPRAAGELETSDDSTRGRLYFWQVAVRMANANPLTGIGHNAFNKAYNTYDFSDGLYGYGRSVHSSWFGVLAEHGYPGFLIFIILNLHCYVTTRRAQRLAKLHVELKDLGTYAAAIEAALVVFLVGGSFLIFQYSEMLWHMLALAIVVGRLVRERSAALAQAAPSVGVARLTPVPAPMLVTPRAAARRTQA
jgi:probable O-glycosylation ligase (exosortase A-associated)